MLATRTSPIRGRIAALQSIPPAVAQIVSSNVPASANALSQMTVTVTVTNIYTDPAIIDLKYSIVAGGVVTEVDSDQGPTSVAAGATQDFTFTFTVPRYVGGTENILINTFEIIVSAYYTDVIEDQRVYTVTVNPLWVDSPTGAMITNMMNLMITMMIVVMMMKMMTGAMAGTMTNTTTTALARI